MRRALVMVAVLVAGLTLLTTPAVAAAPATARSASAVANAPIHDGGSRPGDVVEARPLAAALPARATRIRYRSTDTNDRPITVSGTVLTPLLPSAGPRRLVGYAVGTQGLADRCAPSNQFAAGTEYESGFVSQLLARGYAVAVTDYQGLGTPGEHTYVNRKAQGHAVLDAVRAAQRLGTAPPAGKVALAGYSQGGGASASAAELAPSYAPEIDLVGAYAGAVPADLAAVAAFVDGRPGASLLAYAINGFRAAYPDLPIDQVLNDRGRRILTETRSQCVQDTVPRYPGLRTETLTRDGRPLTAYLAEEPFRARVAQQLLGDGRAPKVPALIVHSIADDIVPIEQDRALARRWCDQGAAVQFMPTPVPTHVGAAAPAFTAALGFLEARFAGSPPASTCGT